MDSIYLVLSAFIKTSINYDTNCGSLLLRTVCGIPCNFQVSFQYIFAIFSDETLIIVALSQIIFVN